MHVYGAAPGDISPCEILTEGLTPDKGNVTKGCVSFFCTALQLWAWQI